MKVLFVQVSDMHCRSTDFSLREKISKISNALKHLGKVDHVVLIFSGDLTDTASAYEFEIGKNKIGQLLKELSDEFNCGFIPTCIVPGNHDIVLEDGCRSADEILSWKLDEHIDEELCLMNDFFDYAKRKKCFMKNKVCDNLILTFENIRIQVSLLNSAPFSTKKNDNKQLHYFPSYVGEKLHRNIDVDIKISVMHHNYEWCEWNTKEMLRAAFEKDDIVFLGHDHKPETISMKNSNGNDINIVMGGFFCLNEMSESSFNAVIFDTCTESFNTYTYTWDKSKLLFTYKHMNEFRKKNIMITPQLSYTDKLLQDKQHSISKSVIDYFVVPKISIYGSEYSYNVDSKRLDATDIFEMLLKESIIRISGASGSGKTTLLKYLFMESSKRGYVPLFIEKRKYNDNRFNKILKDMFELQYGENFNCYEQFDHSKEIVFIDDLDQIDDSDFSNRFVQFIVSSGRLLIFTTKDIFQDIETVAKEKMKESELRSLVINPFYKETRDELVKSIGVSLSKSKDEISVAITALDYLVQCQAKLFTSSPANLLQYILFFFNQNEYTDKGTKTLSLVFETNIRTSILGVTNEKDVNIFLSLLEFLAGKMYFCNRSEKLNIHDFELFISEFNNKRMTQVNPKKFQEACIKARIFKTEESSFDVYFNDNNVFAYFVAKFINNELEKNFENTEHLMYVLEHICFGINDTIILFLSYIKSNIKIILKIVALAESILEKYPEWSIDDSNLKFLNLSSEVSASVSEREIKEAKKNTEIIEKKRHDSVKFNGIFDYSETSVNNERYRVLRALKFTQIIGRAMVDQFGSIDAEELQIITNAVYLFPQKIIYAILKNIDDRFMDICTDLKSFANNEIPDKDFSDIDIKQIVADSGLVFAMNVMNDISYNCSNRNTLNALNQFSAKTQNHEIMWLMMQENGIGTKQFVELAISMYKKYDSNVFMRNIINMIVRKHIMYTPEIDSRQIDKLFSAKISSKSNRSLPSSKREFSFRNQVASEKQSMILTKGKGKKN